MLSKEEEKLEVTLRLVRILALNYNLLRQHRGRSARRRRVGDKVEVYVDGGIRCGTDVLKAIACGARAVFIGRPVLWGLASGAEAGVRYVLEMLRQEFDLAMALSGCPTLSSITRDLIRRL